MPKILGLNPAHGRPRTAKEKGVALLLTAVFTVCLIPVVGLAIDASYMYVIRAKLATAADAAAWPRRAT